MDAEAGEKPWVMSVKAVITDAEGRHLLLKRSTKCRSHQGAWEWPGGKLDPGEDFAAGLAREVREECGLEVVFTGLAGASEFELPQVRVVLLCLHARATGGEVHLSEEHDAFDWAPAAELLDRPIVPPMKPVIRQISLA